MFRSVSAAFLSATLASAAFAGAEAPGETHFEWEPVSATEFRSPEAVYQTKSGRDCFRRVFIPEEIGDRPIRGVIVWDAERHYYPNGPRSTIQSELWRAFAAKHRFGMAELATRPLNVEETVTQIQQIFEDMDRLYGRTECRHACFTFGGTSGTGADTLELAEYRPTADRMIAGIPCSTPIAARYDRGQPPRNYIRKIPLLLLLSGREHYPHSTVAANLRPAAKFVRKGDRITFAVRLSAGHPEFRDDLDSKKEAPQRIAHSMILATKWLDAVLAQRVPEGDPPAGRSTVLQELDPAEFWLGTATVEPGDGIGSEIDRGEDSTAVAQRGHILTDCEIGPADSFPGGRGSAVSWFPNRAVAEAWKTYHETGTLPTDD